MIACNCLNVGTDDEKDIIRLDVIKMLFDDKLEITHCNIVNEPYSNEITLKFSKKKR